MKRKIIVLFGTRPEAIKMAPVIKELEKYRAKLQVKVVVTAQHREMLDQVLGVFKIKTDYDLNLMRPAQTLAQLNSRLLSSLEAVFRKEKPQLVLVQGDTTTTMAGSLAAFYQRIPVGHVEAGLRTSDKYQPYPEEINRRITTLIADLHFAPTKLSRANLLQEGVAKEKVFVTGNTVIDALQQAVALARRQRFSSLQRVYSHWGKVVTVTAHRRENWGAPLRSICRAIKKLAREFPKVLIVLPVHLNPQVQRSINQSLGGLSNVLLLKPLSYLEFVTLMDRSCLLLTDSGGIQEEAPSLAKPVLVLREVTERPEAVKAGTVKLVGTQEEKIYRSAKTLLVNYRVYLKMAQAVNPYGDGRASERIAAGVMKYFGFKAKKTSIFDPAF